MSTGPLQDEQDRDPAPASAPAPACVPAATAERTGAERFHALLAHAFDIIHVADAQGRIRYMTPAVERVLGYTPEEMVGRFAHEFVHPDDLEVARRTFDEDIARAGAERFLEIRLRARDGSWKTVEIAGRVLPDGDEMVAVVHTRDVTLQRRAEAALRESEARLAAIIGSAMDAIISLDDEHRVVLFNHAAEEIFRCRARDVLGRPVTDLMPERYRAGHPEHLRRFAEAGESTGRVVHAGRMFGLRADGEEFPIEASLSQILLGGQRIFTVIMRDVSERSRMEEQLRQAQKMEAAGRLAGGICHDFNNILTAIAGHANLALDEVPAGDPLADDLREIRRGTERAAVLTRQLLAFSRKQVMQPRVLDLNEVVREMEPVVGRVLREDVVLHVALDAGLGRVKADPAQLEQALVNLAVNARDAMPSGGTLRIETRRVVLGEEHRRRFPELRPGPHALLTVADEGGGMPAEVMSHLFEPFFTTKEVGQGTGLGLSTVYGIVRQSGGQIGVESEVGRGTCFSIYLPEVPTPDEEAEAAASRPAPGPGVVLLVEDEHAVRALARRVLERQGLTVLEAASGPEALERCEAHAGRLDLVVSDVVMPRMSGTELAERLRELRPGVRVLFISGYNADALREDSVLPPGTAFLQKPFTPALLVDKVREVLAAA